LDQDRAVAEQERFLDQELKVVVDLYGFGSVEDESE